MIRSTYTAVTGMKAFQEALAVTSNNIANSQTTGYKSQRAIFSDLVYSQLKTATASDGNYAGSNPMSMGSGVKMSSIKNNISQGGVQSTGGKTDVSIEGNGYFVVGNGNGNDVQYTRKGNFQLAENGYLTTEDGKYVLGWETDSLTGQLDPYGKASPIGIPMDQAVQGSATTKAKLSGNIDFTIGVGEGIRTQLPIFDSAGQRTNLSMEYIRKDNGTFSYAAIPNEAFNPSANIKSALMNVADMIDVLEQGDYKVRVTGPTAPSTTSRIELLNPDGSVFHTQDIDNVDQKVTLSDGVKNFMTIDFVAAADGANTEATVRVGAVGEIAFGTTGRVQTVTPKGGVPGDAVKVEFISNATGQNVSVGVDMSAITNFATDTSIGVGEVDGGQAASIRDFSITDDGAIMGEYSDGTVRMIGKIAVATFANDEGLVRLGTGNYMSSAASGEARVLQSGQAGAGIIRSQSLENSNVDLSNEFIDLMTFQKSYQANTKTIQVSNEVVDSILQLIR